MSSAKDPFLVRETSCPSCGGVYLQRYFKNRAFLADKRESDQHIVSYKWLQEGMRQVHPPFYFLFFCPYCYFTDSAEDFAQPQQVDGGRLVADSYRRSNGCEDSVVHFLGDRVNYGDICFDVALALHFLAIYQQLLTPGDVRNHYKIARLYLRIAWLYRECAPQSPTPAVLKRAEACDALREARDASLELLSRSEAAIHGALNIHDELHGMLTVYRNAHTVPPHDAEYIQLHDVLRGTYEAQLANLHQIRSVIADETIMDAMPAVSMVYESGHEGFLGFDSHKEFMKTFKNLWTIAPVDEIEAIRASIPHFEKAVSSDPRFDSPQAYFSIASLIIDLRVRCNDLDPAFAMIRGIYKAASDSRQACMSELQDPELDDIAKQRVMTRMTRIATMLQQAAELRRQLLDHLAQRDWPIIERIMQDNPKADSATLEKILEGHGISPGLITHLRETGKISQLAGSHPTIFA